jgi:hypothetical protein
VSRRAGSAGGKDLALMVGGTAIGLAGTLANLIMAIVEPHLINAEIAAFAAAAFSCVAAYYGYLAFLKFKASALAAR